MELCHNKLRGKIVEKGYTMRSLSDKTGIPVSTLSNKINGLTEFKASEILIISECLDISNIKEYFFTPKVRNIERI